MKRTGALFVIVTALLSGCATEAPWPDRPWVDAGCEAEGECAVRGRLKVIRGVPHSGGVLTLDDGRCLPVALPPEIVTRWQRWDGRRVAVRGRAMSRGGEGADVVSVQYGDRFLPTGLCPVGDLVLYANRLSLKGG